KGVHVNDNQAVKKGDLLLEIEPVDYEVRVKEAASGLEEEKARRSEIAARIEASKKQMSELKAAVETAKANLLLQEANLRQAERDMKRAENLFNKDAVSRERYEKITTAYDVAFAQVKASREQLKQAEMAVEAQRAVVRQAEAAGVSQLSSIKRKEAGLQAAELNYGYTKIYAPSGGYITRKSVETGNQIQAGQPLMAVASLGETWITANYKETQLEKIRPGQKARIKVDTYPGKIFSGTVESVMAGTGSIFSLFPPENATGNFVKVVQRVPVKIVLDKNSDPGHILRIGMSVVPTVIIGK
ncbi:MAG: HlyD family secretion protein, partial [Nitrospirae bacterium]|nr:HlyD family secretion protein [Nitrospirota bacterium]